MTLTRRGAIVAGVALLLAWIAVGWLVEAHCLMDYCANP